MLFGYVPVLSAGDWTVRTHARIRVERPMHYCTGRLQYLDQGHTLISPRPGDPLLEYSMAHARIGPTWISPRAGNRRDACANTRKEASILKGYSNSCYCNLFRDHWDTFFASIRILPVNNCPISILKK
jgi:hypothetical protein